MQGKPKCQSLLVRAPQADLDPPIATATQQQLLRLKTGLFVAINSLLRLLKERESI